MYPMYNPNVTEPVEITIPFQENGNGLFEALQVENQQQLDDDENRANTTHQYHH